MMGPRYNPKYESATINSLNKTYLNALQACVDSGYRTAVFLPLHLAAPLLHFTVGFAFHAIDLVFCLYQCLFFLALGGLNGVTDQTLGFLLGGTKLCFSNLHSILNAQKKGDDSGNQYESYRCDYHKPQFHLYHWSGSILSYECIVKVPPLRGRG